MKRYYFTEVVLVILMIVFASCEGVGPGGNNDGGGQLPDETTFSVSGSFTKKGGGEVKFSLSDAKNYSRATATSESYAVSGELVDGDIIFRLKGTYDPISLKYTASASSSLIRYSIDGAFDENG
ncbi:MAG TPA: hypothetical protein DEQ14_08835 [Treponema sp.]|nr:hypothetical protein [Treponema sp.]